MASTRNYRILLLIFGVVSLAALNSAFKLRDTFEEGGDEADFTFTDKEQSNARIDFNDIAPSQDDQEETAGILNEDDKQTEPILQRRDFYSNPTDAKFNSNISRRGNYIEYDSNGICVTVLSPRRPQSIQIKGKKVFVNERLVCPDVKLLKPESTYQKRRDGSMWFTNLPVGTPMTEEEEEEFKNELKRTVREQKARQNETSNINQRAMEGGVELQKLREALLAAERQEQEIALAEKNSEMTIEQLKQSLTEAENDGVNTSHEIENEKETAEKLFTDQLEQTMEVRDKALRSAEKDREEGLEQKKKELEAIERTKEEALEEAQRATQEAENAAEAERQKAAEQRAKALEEAEENLQNAEEFRGQKITEETLRANLKAMKRQLIADERKREKAAEMKVKALIQNERQKERDLHTAKEESKRLLQQLERQYEREATAEAKTFKDTSRKMRSAFNLAEMSREKAAKERLRALEVAEKKIQNNLTLAERERKNMMDQRVRASQVAEKLREKLKLAEADKTWRN